MKKSMTGWCFEKSLQWSLIANLKCKQFQVRSTLAVYTLKMSMWKRHVVSSDFLTKIRPENMRSAAGLKQFSDFCTIMTMADRIEEIIY